jgi:hypothetical protein
MKNKLISTIIFLIICFSSFGQSTSVSFESTSQKYFEDKKSGVILPDNIYGSNNYLSFTCNYKNFTAGLRYESYLPVLQGYSNVYNKSDIANKYITFTNDFVTITAGNFYEQFGSGLIYRSYEERQLGMDNSTYGVKVIFNPTDYLSIKAINGQQRNGFEIGKGMLKGADLSLFLSELTKLPVLKDIQIGYSFLNKYEDYTGTNKDFDGSVNSESYRLDYNNDFSSLYIEYVKKDNDLFDSKLLEGKSLYINSSLYIGDLSISGSYRKLENMESRSERQAQSTELFVNYIPTLTKQHKYSLCNVYVYAVNTNDEVAYQFDVYYSINDYLFALNHSSAQKTTVSNNEPENGRLFTSTSLEISKEWGNFKSKLLVNNIFYGQKAIEENGLDEIKSFVAVADITYQASSKLSFRTEFQHLWNESDSKNWAAVLLETSFAPHWTVFVGDDYNYGGEGKNHYYNSGFSYTVNSTQIMMSYGLTKGGLNCVGGVCRFLPRTKALTLSLTTKF